MRILHIIDSDGLYGAEMLILSLMESQRKMGHYPILLSLGDTGVGMKDIEIEAKARGLETSALRFRNGFNLNGTIQILKYSRKLEADVLHCHGYKGDILLGIVPRSLRKMHVITTLHGWTSTHFYTKMGIYQLFDAIAIKRLDKAVAVSSVVQKHPFLKILGVHPVVIKNGIPKLDFKKKELERQFPEIAARCKNHFTIVSIGRLSPEKGFDVLINAVARMVKKGLNLFLILVGEGRSRSHLMQLAKKNNISDKIVFLGYQEKAFQFIPFFDMFALPSYTEGLPITLLEAMQAGTPIVATRVGEVPLLLEQGKFGELVFPGETAALAAAIEYVHNNRHAARQKAILAQKKALVEYGAEKMTNAYLEQYYELLFAR